MTGKNATETLPAIGQAANGAIRRAAEVLRADGLVAVPTETVYGLAARADSDEAVAAIYRAKGRPGFNPLIVHVSDLAQAETIAGFDDVARRVAQAAWPGPLTLVLPRREDGGMAAAVSAGLETIALRCPVHPVMRALLAETGLPLAAPSANRSNAISPTCAQHVRDSLGGRIDLILDGGPSADGIESTILAIRHDGRWEELRSGPVDIGALYQAITGREWIKAPAEPRANTVIEAPGQLRRHYSPGKPVRLDAKQAEPDEFHIGLGAIGGDTNLSPSGDLAEAAAHLYAALHAGAASPQPRIAVAPIPPHGVGAAINDRLARAAA